MVLKIYQIDAFTNKLFGGNPAAVVPLESWLPDEIMQKIALENNLSETAFFVKENDNFKIRWFTPTTEVPLCGHATLASSFVIFNFLEKQLQKIIFHSESGPLYISKNNDLITLDFPQNKVTQIEISQEIIDIIGFKPFKVYEGNSIVVLLNDEIAVRELHPKMNLLARLKTHGVIVTAKGDNSDFVSRFFIPQSGIDEDPVTGYAHTVLTPLWAGILGKNKLHAFQVSQRGGELYCELADNRVKISGKAKLYFKGKIFI